MFCVNLRSYAAEPANICFSKRDGSESIGKEYISFWQQSEDCRDCSLLLAVLSTLWCTTPRLWRCSDISLIFRYCELLNWYSWNPSRDRWPYWFPLFATAVSLSISWSAICIKMVYFSPGFSLLLLFTIWDAWHPFHILSSPCFVCQRQVVSAY